METLRDCAFLSSGTLATLTGERDCYVLDEIQGKLCEWVSAKLADGTTFKSWMDAWDAFKGDF